MYKKHYSFAGFGSSEIIIAVSVLIAVGIIVGAVLLSKTSLPGTLGTASLGNGGAIPIANAPIIGNPSAPVTLTEFLDFQCSACGAFFTQIEPQLRQTYVNTGKVKVAVKILTFIDSYKTGSEESRDAGVAALCANDQGKFVQMHDAIYTAEQAEVKAGKNNENSGNLTRDFFLQTAQNIGLTMPTFTSCFDAHTHADELAMNLADAQQAMPEGVSTPALFINGTRIANPFDFSSLSASIDAQLNAASSSTSTAQ